MNTLFSEKQLLLIKKIVTTYSKLSLKPLNTTIIDNTYVASGIFCSQLLFHNSFSKQFQLFRYFQYMNRFIQSLEGEICPIHTPIVPKTIKYIGNHFQSFQHRLWRNTPLCLLYHSQRYSGFLLVIISNRDSPGRKQVFPRQICSLTNLTSPVSVCTIWITIIIQRTIIQIWLDHWAETLHIDIKHLISRIRCWIEVNKDTLLYLWAIPLRRTVWFRKVFLMWKGHQKVPSVPNNHNGYLWHMFHW